MTRVFSSKTVNLEKSTKKPTFEHDSRPEPRIITDRDDLVRKVDAYRELGRQIVVTSGSFDLTHIGHARYLETAKGYGDILIVGVDSDEKVRRRKGETRPVVPDTERMEMLAHLQHVDLVTIKHADEPKWDLIRRLRPDTLIVTGETYTDDVLDKLTKFCGQIVCLDPQATTSTSAQIRKVEIGWRRDIAEPIDEILRTNDVSEEVRRKIADLLIRPYEP